MRIQSVLKEKTHSYNLLYCVNDFLALLVLLRLKV